MSFFDDLDWNARGSTYGQKHKTAGVSSKSLGGFRRWSNPSSQTASTRASKGREFLSRFEDKFKDKFRD
jgi:hypothetical protein